MGTALRVAGLLVLGLVVGVASVLVHAAWWGWPLVVASTATTAYALPAVGGRRLAFVGAWGLSVGVLLIPRAEGDYLVAANARGYLLLGWGLALVVAGFATLPSPRRRPPGGRSPDLTTPLPRMNA